MRAALDRWRGPALIVLVLAPLVVAQALGYWVQGLGEIAAAGIALVVVGGLFLATSDAGRGAAGSPALVTVALAGALVAVMRALAAINPGMSLSGGIGSPHGAATAVLFAGSLSVGLLALEPRDRTWAFAGMAASGTLAAVAAFAELAGLVTLDNRYVSELTGLLADSAILAQVLVLSLGAAYAWSRLTSSRASRLISQACMVIMVAAMLLSQSRSGIAVLIVFGALLAAHRFGLLSRRGALSVGLALVFSCSIAVAALGAGLVPDALEAAINQTLNERASLWQSTAAQVAQDPLIGQGPNQFTALTLWDVDPGLPLAVDPVGTISPHSVLWDVLTSTGLVGLLLLIVGCALWGRSALGRPRSEPLDDDRPAVGMTIAWFGWAVLALTQVLHPLVLVYGGLAAGMLAVRSGARALEPDVPRSARSPIGWSAVVAVLVVICGLAAVGLVARPLAVARVVLAELDTTGDVSAATFERAYGDFSDPQYALNVKDAYLLDAAAGRESAKENLAAATILLEKDASWNVHSALAMAVSWAAVGGEEASDGFDRAMEAGSLADPASSMWPYLQALRAEATGSPDEAQQYAREALEAAYLPEAAHQDMERLAAAP